MRCLLLLPCAAWIAACYSPNDDVIASNGDDGGSSSAEDSTGGSVSASSTVTTPADTSGDPSADTASTEPDPTAETGEDAPPVIEEFSVQGSQAPAEISAADTVVLAADVSDDLGVARVEFYDGGSLIATVDAAPWQTEFLVTSADNGGHSYTAIAYDTSDQTADAGPIPLSVNIEGGAVLELRENVFRSRNLAWVYGAPMLSMAPDGDLVLAGSAVYEGPGFTNTRLTAIRYTETLSELWQRDYPASMSAGTPGVYVYSAPALRDDAFVLLTGSSDDGTLTENLLRPLSMDDGSVGSSIELPFEPPQGVPARGVVTDPSGNMVAVTVDGTLLKLDQGGSPLWQADVLAALPSHAYFPRLSLDLDGNVLVDVVDLGGEDTILRKYSPDGALLWTRDNGWATTPLADGTIVSVGSWFAQDSLTLLHRDADGNELSAMELDVETPYTISVADIAATPDGDIVCAGMRQTNADVPEAWVARASADGETAWWTLVDVGSRNVATGVAVSEAGRLYVAGHADDESGPLFLEFVADAWIAELAL